MKFDFFEVNCRVRYAAPQVRSLRKFRVDLYRRTPQYKVPTSMHSVRLEPTKLILIGTRITYQATGDASCCSKA